MPLNPGSHRRRIGRNEDACLCRRGILPTLADAHRRCGGPFDYTKDLSNDGLRVWGANSDFWAMLLLSCTTAITGGMHGKEDQS